MARALPTTEAYSNEADIGGLCLLCTASLLHQRTLSSPTSGTRILSQDVGHDVGRGSGSTSTTALLQHADDRLSPRNRPCPCPIRPSRFPLVVDSSLVRSGRLASPTESTHDARVSQADTPIAIGQERRWIRTQYAALQPLLWSPCLSSVLPYRRPSWPRRTASLPSGGPYSAGVSDTQCARQPRER